MGLDRRWDRGPFDIVGDVHGCGDELLSLLRRLGYSMSAGSYRHPAGRRLVFLGDLVDRGPQVAHVLELVMDVVSAETGLCILGNHEDKLARALRGNDVHVTHGLAESLAQLSQCDAAFIERVRGFLGSLEPHCVLDDAALVVAHAGLPEEFHGEESKRARGLALYGDATVDDQGFPERALWAKVYSGSAAVVYGHTPVAVATWTNNTINIDTGCVFGGSLTALRWPERELVSTPALAVHYQPEFA